MKTIATIFTILYLSTITAFSQDDFLASFTTIIVDEDGKKMKNVTVTIYKENDILFTATTKGNGKISFDVPLGSYYTLELKKEGYLTKRIAIKAYDKENRVEYDALPFKFMTELIKIKTKTPLDAEILDFPVAILEYKADKDEFEFVRSYTKQMQTIQKQLIKEMEQNLAMSDEYVE